MANDYTFKYTDPTKTPFVVKSYTINGYAAPDSVPTPPFFSSGTVAAVSANTSLVFVGKGIPEYGDVVQNNFLYLLENFANENPPVAPSQGQLWYNNTQTSQRGLYLYDGAAWNKTILGDSTGALISDIDLNGNTILNMDGVGVNYTVANQLFVTTHVATELGIHAGDAGLHLTVDQNNLLDGLASTLTATELNYVDGVTSPIQTQLDGKLSLSGGTVSGPLAMSGNKILGVGTPTLIDDAATKEYVDLVAGTGNTGLATHMGDSDVHLTLDQNTLLDGLAPTLTATELNYVDGVTSPIQTQLDGKLSLSGGPISGDINCIGLYKIQNLATPVLAGDAATKDYVDTQLSSGGSDGVVDSGTFSSVTGTLTLYRTIGAPVVVSGTMAAKLHQHTDAQVTHDVSAPIPQSFVIGAAMGAGTYPNPPLYDTVMYLDQATYEQARPVHRQLIVSNGSTTLHTLRTDMEYSVYENKLQVFVNGIKQYAHDRGNSTIAIYDSGIGMVSSTGLAVSTSYSFDITVDGNAPETVTILTPPTSPYTHMMLWLDISDELNLLTNPAAINVEQYQNRIEYQFTSLATGAGSSVTVSYAVGSLFESITSTTTIPPVNTSITTNYSYGEIGLPNEPSNQIQFATAPTSGAIIEVLRYT